MRLLHLTDTHLGVGSFFHGAPAGWSRAADHLRAMAAALLPAVREEVDAVVHSGDLFDRSSPPPAAVAEAARLWADVARRVPVVVCPGNHDRKGLLHHFPAGIPGVTIVDEPAVVELRDVRLGVVPYLDEGWAQRAPPGCDLLVAHQAFDGARVPGYTFRAARREDTLGADAIPAGTRWILCGHIHPRQVGHVGGATVVYPGSTERTAFAERFETKGYAVWDLGREVRWRHVDLATRPMVVVRAEADVADVTEGALVKLEGDARTRAVEAAVFARGGWVAPWPRGVERQARLFGR